MSSATARITWPVTCWLSSLANQATSGDETAGSIRFHSSSGTSSASITGGAPGIVAVMRVAAAGPPAVPVTPENRKRVVWGKGEAVEIQGVAVPIKKKTT